MKKPEYWIFHAGNGLVVGTGLVYGWMRYLLSPVNEFAVVNHPQQPLMQHLHVLAAPVLVGLLGHFLYRHAWTYWRIRIKEGRYTGLNLFLLAVPMVASGYFLQVSVSEGWRTTWAWVHGLVSCAWIAVSVLHTWLHLFGRNRRRRS